MIGRILLGTVAAIAVGVGGFAIIEEQNKRRRLERRVSRNEDRINAYSGLAGDSDDDFAFFEDDKEYKARFLELIPKADTGNAENQYQLGLLYKEADYFNRTGGVFRWFEKAAKKGHVEAMYELGLLYEDLDEENKALKWFNKAATKDHKLAKEKVDEIKKARAYFDEVEDEEETSCEETDDVELNIASEKA